MSECRRTSRGVAGRCSPGCSRIRSRARAGCGGSTSTATARATSAGTAASSGRCSSTSSTPTATGSASSAASDLVHGQFGENFTIEGLADDEVCIGDRFAIGSAVFEVTQPRVTCYRVGIRMDDPRIPALLVSHQRPGFYFRVLEEGDVQAGDAIVKVAAGPEQMTVAEIDGAALPAPGTRAGSWRGRCGSRRSAPAGRRRSARCLDGDARQRERRPPGGGPAAGLARLPAADRRRRSSTRATRWSRSGSRTRAARRCRPPGPAST